MGQPTPPGVAQLSPEAAIHGATAVSRMNPCPDIRGRAFGGANVRWTFA